MKINTNSALKRRHMISAVVFLTGILLLFYITFNTDRQHKQLQRERAELNAATYSEHIMMQINNGINAADTLRQIIISENGNIDGFYDVAENLMTDYLQSLQIAPGGVVTDIYPAAGNEAGKIDLMHDDNRKDYCIYARDNNQTVMQGPFKLKQGGSGIAVRTPVYIEKTECETFWGFTIAIIRVPDIFSGSLKALQDFGYHINLSKTAAPWDSTYTEMYSCNDVLAEPAEYTFSIGAADWKLQVMPEKGWKTDASTILFFCYGFVVVMLLTGLCYAFIVSDEQRKQLKLTVLIDPLTGIYNRSGFDLTVRQRLKEHPGESCVIAELDIDNFKQINDIYGHAAGDVALKQLARGMEEFFADNAVIGRNGGDEFCIFLTGYTGETAAGLLEAFTKAEKSFEHDGMKRLFSISAGYAAFPEQTDNLELLFRYADAALYEVKLRGKNGCQAYSEGFREIRSQLGFALKDVSEHLPGAFLIYKATADNDELLFANRDMIRLAGCEDMNDFMEYTEGSFRNLIVPEDRSRVEAEIWEQINSGSNNDYVAYSIVRKDKTTVDVLDYGRIVESQHYGRIFYVLIMDRQNMKKHFA